MPWIRALHSRRFSNLFEILERSTSNRKATLDPACFTRGQRGHPLSGRRLERFAYVLLKIGRHLIEEAGCFELGVRQMVGTGHVRPCEEVELDLGLGP